MSADAAERLTTRIRLCLDTIADNIEQVVPLIEEAKAANVHEALGYRSWTAYVSERFGGVLGRLDRSERRPLVLLLSEQGMSTRAIGSVVGASEGTVRNDLAGAQDYAPGPVTGIDGKTYVRRERESVRLPNDIAGAVRQLNELDAQITTLRAAAADLRAGGAR